MKKKNLALFDLDDTLFDGDTEGEWVKYMDKAGPVSYTHLTLPTILLV